MSRWAKKQLTSLSYLMQKTYWKLTTAKPSTLVLAGLAIAISVFLLGGGIFAFLEKPLVALVLSGGRLFFYYPGLGMQSVSEGIFVMILYTLGIVGFLLAYQSTKYAYRPRQAFMMLLIGMVFVLIAYMSIEVLFSAKLRGF